MAILKVVRRDLGGCGKIDDLFELFGINLINVFDIRIIFAFDTSSHPSHPHLIACFAFIRSSAAPTLLQNCRFVLLLSISFLHFKHFCRFIMAMNGG